MKPYIIIVILIAIILTGAIAFIVIGQEGIIPPYDEEDPDPDSGDDNPDVAIRIDTPSQASYAIEETGCYSHVRVDGTVYGTEPTIVDSVELCWHDCISYGKKTLFSSDQNFYKYDNYNYRWKTDMVIGRLGSGSHILRAKAMSGPEVIAEATVNIIIPEKWVYGWDSRNPRKEDAVYRGVDGGPYFYGFTFPFKHIDVNDNEQWRYLSGEIIRVKGQVHAGLATACNYGNEKRWCTRDLWLEAWNSNIQKWAVIDQTVSISVCTDGTGCENPGTWNTMETWTDVDKTVNNVWCNEIGFAGCIFGPEYGDGNIMDVVDGFVGEVWIKPGTINYQQNALDFLLSMFPQDQDDPPHQTIFLTE